MTSLGYFIQVFLYTEAFLHTNIYVYSYVILFFLKTEQQHASKEKKPLIQQYCRLLCHVWTSNTLDISSVRYAVIISAMCITSD